MYDLIAVPGRKMKDDIISKGLSPADKIVEIGYPKIDYFLHSNFDEEHFKKEIGIDGDKKVILYSPTWYDPDHYSSYGIFIKSIIKDFIDYNVIIKPHPNILKYRPWQIIKTYILKRKNCFLYSGSLSILPLMKISDIMLTDISSVSHEYLPFDKPMIFLAPKPVNSIPEEHRWIWRCGDVVENTIFLNRVVRENLKNPDKYRDERMKALNYIFTSFDGRSAVRFKDAIEKFF